MAHKVIRFGPLKMSLTEMDLQNGLKRGSIYKDKLLRINEIGSPK